MTRFHLLILVITFSFSIGTNVSAQQEVIIDGQTFIQYGDMLLEEAPPTQPYNQDQLVQGKNTSTRMVFEYESGKRYSYLLWENGRVPFSVSPAFSTHAKRIIYYAIESLKKKTNICFVEEKKESGKAFLEIVSLEEDHAACGNATIGSSIKAKLRLKESCLQKSVAVGIVLHELGHALGLFHTHQLPSSRKYLNILENNIDTDFLSAYQLITSLPAQYPDAYDPWSIMHYAPSGGAKDPNKGLAFECKGKTGFGTCPDYIGDLRGLSTGDEALINTLYPEEGCIQFAALYLMDVSGSMAENNKIGQAKAAVSNSLDQVTARGKGQISVAIHTFSGGCVPNPVKEVFPFSRDAQAAKQLVDQSPAFRPGGGTPLPAAIQLSEKALKDYMCANAVPKSRIIILSDGQSTCGPIRPDEVYAFQKNKFASRDFDQSNCSSPIVAATGTIKFFTIGFGIAPGSPAERDLQYLAGQTGGKYLNAQNQFELTRAFEKSSKVYMPRMFPGLDSLAGESVVQFYQIVQLVLDEEFKTALPLAQAYHSRYPEDCNGRYNLALLFEANDRYKSAAATLQEFLNQCADESEKDQIRQQIEQLKREYADHLEYIRKVIQSDRDFLEQHFQHIMNGQSIPLANEFTGFIQEKGDFYNELAATLETENRQIQQMGSQIQSALERCRRSIRQHAQGWDRNAVPYISPVFLQLNKLIEELDSI